MLLWILFAAMTALVLVAISWPILRQPADAESRAESDRAVYADQLKALERDVRNGLISDREAEGARTEIARRLLAAVDDDGGTETTAATAVTPTDATSSVALRPTLLAIMVAVPVLAMGTYLTVGSPG